jgi:hypothetical protein
MACRYIVLLGGPEMIVPGGSSACVLLFDGASKRISSWCFQTGWRISLDSASFENTAEERASLLDSADKADVLSALVFLRGRHITEPQRHFAPEPAESKYAWVFQQLVGSPHIREMVARLSHSDSEWVRQAALLAVREPREQLLQQSRVHSQGGGLDKSIWLLCRRPAEAPAARSRFYSPRSVAPRLPSPQPLITAISETVRGQSATDMDT